MTFNPQQGQTNSGAQWSKDNRRRSGRMQIESVGCNLGSVLNLSNEGMQILCSRLPKEPLQIELTGCETQLVMKGEIAWVRKVSFFKKIVGIHFIDVKPEQHGQLTSLAMTNTIRRRIA